MNDIDKIRIYLSEVEGFFEPITNSDIEISGQWQLNGQNGASCTCESVSSPTNKFLPFPYSDKNIKKFNDYYLIVSREQRKEKLEKLNNYEL